MRVEVVWGGAKIDDDNRISRKVLSTNGFQSPQSTKMLPPVSSLI